MTRDAACVRLAFQDEDGGPFAPQGAGGGEARRAAADDDDVCGL
jgi:hypothetical protein